MILVQHIFTLKSIYLNLSFIAFFYQIFINSFSSFLPAPIAKITVAAPVTISPPAKTPSFVVFPVIAPHSPSENSNQKPAPLPSLQGYHSQSQEDHNSSPLIEQLANPHEKTAKQNNGHGLAIHATSFL